MRYAAARKYVESLVNNEKSLHQSAPQHFHLTRIKRVLKALSDFHKDLKIVHIAGSKGKGSVAAMTASMLKEGGYTVGLFASPHIQDLRERIRLLKKPVAPEVSSPQPFSDLISKRDFAQGVSVITQRMENLHPRDDFRLTFFEFITVLALYHFHRKRAEIVILETGLGGRKDATSVAPAMISVLTVMTLEHTHILGNTIRKIAGEKAAIIKKTTQEVVVAQQAPEACEVINRRCRTWGIQPYYAQKHIGIDVVSRDRHRQRIRLYYLLRPDYGFLPSRPIDLPLAGEHQLSNAKVALGIILALRKQGFGLTKTAVAQGLQRVHWPLRFEMVHSAPLVILDGAHTVISAQALVETVRDLYPRAKVTLVLGIAADKDIAGICRALNIIADKVYFTRFAGKRAAMVSQAFLSETFKGKDCLRVRSLPKALSAALSDTRADLADRLILVTGSIFLASEARIFFKTKAKALSLIGIGAKKKS